MSNTSKTPAVPETAPPEAYAAFVRIYMDWLGRTEDEQIALVEKSVRSAERANVRFGGMGFLTQRNGIIYGNCLYGAEFDEYVNEVWAVFLEECDDVDKFAVYLQKSFERKWSDGNAKEYMRKCQDKFDKMRDKFIDEKSEEWADKAENLEGDELKKYLEEELEKFKEEFEKMKSDFEDNVVELYPSLRTLLRRPAQNMISRNRNSERRARKSVSLNAGIRSKEGGKLPLDIEDETGNGLAVEEQLALQDIMDRTVAALSEEDAEIFKMKMEGYKNTEIAEKLGIANSTVTNRIKKIMSVLSNLL